MPIIRPYLHRDVYTRTNALIFIKGEPGLPVMHVEYRGYESSYSWDPEATVILDLSVVQIFQSDVERMIAAVQPGYQYGLVLLHREPPCAGILKFKDHEFLFNRYSISPGRVDTVDITTMGSPVRQKVVSNMEPTTLSLTLPVRNEL